MKIRAEWFGLALVVAIGFLMLWQQLDLCRFGFDFTDEGFYLNSLNNRFPVHDKQFGELLRPLWLLVGKDVALLRQANVLFTIALAFALCVILLRGMGEEGSLGRVQRYCLAFAMASTSCLAFFFMSIPSYNSLAFQALLVAAIALALADRTRSRTSILGWLLLGAAGCLAFLAKPPTSIALAALAIASVVCARRVNPTLVGLAAVTAAALLIAFAFASAGSPLSFASGLTESAKDVLALEAGHDIQNWIRLERIELSRLEWAIMAIAFAAAWLGVAASSKPNRWLLWQALLAAAVAASAALGLNLISWRSAGTYRALPLLAVGLGSIAGALTLRRGRLALGAWCALALFLLLPYAYALGSNNGYWWQMQHAAFFWLCAGVIALASLPDRSARWRAWLLAIALAQAIAVNSGAVSAERPYRQPQPLRQNSEWVNLRPGGSPLLLSKEAADYIKALREAATEHGFEPGSPLLDLTGHSSGSAFVLGAEPLGAAWIIGGRRGSVASATRILDRASADKMRLTWVLTEPGGRRHLPDCLLERYGLSLKEDYELVATLSAPKRGRRENAMQALYKPTTKAQTCDADG